MFDLLIIKLNVMNMFVVFFLVRFFKSIKVFFIVFKIDMIVIKVNYLFRNKKIIFV